MDIYILHLHSVVPGFTHLQTDLQCVEWDVKPYYTIPVLVSYVWHFMEGGGTTFYEGRKLYDQHFLSYSGIRTLTFEFTDQTGQSWETSVPNLNFLQLSVLKLQA